MNQTWDLIGNQAVARTPPPFQWGTNPYLEVGGARLNLMDLNKGLLDPSKFDFLRNLGGPKTLPSSGYTFSNLYKPGAAASEGNFQDLIKSIGGQGNINDLQSLLEQPYIKNVMSQIDTGTNQALGAAKSDFADRGLLGPGQTSDIVENALAAIRGAGANTKAGYQYQLGTNALQRDTELQKLLAGAYGSRYTSGQDIASRGALADVGTLNDLLKTGYTTGVQGNIDYANILNQNQSDYYKQLLDSIFKTKGIESGDRQFFDKLASTADQNSLGRTNDYNMAILKKQEEENPWMNLLTAGIGGIAGGLTGGIGTSLGTAAGGMLTSFLKKK